MTVMPAVVCYVYVVDINYGSIVQQQKKCTRRHARLLTAHILLKPDVCLCSSCNLMCRFCPSLSFVSLLHTQTMHVSYFLPYITELTGVLHSQAYRSGR